VALNARELRDREPAQFSRFGVLTRKNRSGRTAGGLAAFILQIVLDEQDQTLVDFP
jgi:hypothetical protein